MVSPNKQPNSAVLVPSYVVGGPQSQVLGVVDGTELIFGGGTSPSELALVLHSPFTTGVAATAAPAVMAEFAMQKRGLFIREVAKGEKTLRVWTRKYGTAELTKTAPGIAGDVSDDGETVAFYSGNVPVRARADGSDPLTWSATSCSNKNESPGMSFLGGRFVTLCGNTSVLTLGPTDAAPTTLSGYSPWPYGAGDVIVVQQAANAGPWSLVSVKDGTAVPMPDFKSSFAGFALKAREAVMIPKRNAVAYVTSGSAVRVVSIAGTTDTFSVPGVTLGPAPIVASPSGRYLAVAGSVGDGFVVDLDAPGAPPIAIPDAASVAFTADGTRLVVLTHAGEWVSRPVSGGPATSLGMAAGKGSRFVAAAGTKGVALGSGTLQSLDAAVAGSATTIATAVVSQTSEWGDGTFSVSGCGDAVAFTIGLGPDAGTYIVAIP